MRRKSCSSCANGAACRLVAAVLARYGFISRTNRRGLCYFRGKVQWCGECVECRLGRPGLTAPLDDLGGPVWIGYYSTDATGDMLFDEYSPSLADFLTEQSQRSGPQTGHTDERHDG